MEPTKLELEELDKSLPKKQEARPVGRFERVFQPCVAELVGTMFFVFIGCVSVIENVEAAGRLQPALVHGLAVAVLVACMAEISGSHFNPPFTIAIWLCGGIPLTMVIPYLISQLIGGVLGAAMSKVMTSHENYVNATGAAFAILKSDEHLGKAVFAETAMTCLVTLVVLMGAVNGKSKSPLVPFMVGCTVIVNILAGKKQQTHTMVAWTEQERAFIQDIFGKLNYDEAGQKAVCRLLIVYPWTQRYFGGFGNLYNADAIMANPMVAAHGRVVINGLDKALKNMDDIKNAYKELSVLHSEKLHVDPDNFRLLGDCLTIVVAASLGKAFTAEMQAAWQKFLAVAISALCKQYH